MTGPGTYDDRTATKEPCVCGLLVTRRAQCPVWQQAQHGVPVTHLDACPLPERGSPRCVSYRRPKPEDR